MEITREKLVKEIKQQYPVGKISKVSDSKITYDFDIVYKNMGRVGFELSIPREKMESFSNIEVYQNIKHLDEVPTVIYFTPQY